MLGIDIMHYEFLNTLFKWRNIPNALENRVHKAVKLVMLVTVDQFEVGCLFIEDQRVSCIQRCVLHIVFLLVTAKHSLRVLKLLGIGVTPGLSTIFARSLRTLNEMLVECILIRLNFVAIVALVIVAHIHLSMFGSSCSCISIAVVVIK